jgi:hypothetical protein
MLVALKMENAKAMERSMTKTENCLAREFGWEGCWSKEFIDKYESINVQFGCSL